MTGNLSILGRKVQMNVRAVMDENALVMGRVEAQYLDGFAFLREREMLSGFDHMVGDLVRRSLHQKRKRLLHIHAMGWSRLRNKRFQVVRRLDGGGNRNRL